MLGLMAANALRGLNEPDEARYALIALEMAQGRSSWWVPRMSDLVHVDKPPLVYWISASAARLLGPGEWALRLPSLSAVLCSLLGLWWLARSLHGPQVVRWALLVCATSLQFWVMGSILSPDMLLTGFLTLAAGAWARAREVPAAHAVPWWIACALCWALAWWTKATVALLMLALLVLSLLLARDPLGLQRLRTRWLVVVVLVLGAPWYLDLMQRFPELRDFFLRGELLGRVVGHADGRQEPAYYYPALATLAWLPWWPLVVALLWQGRRRLAETGLDDGCRRIGVEGWMVLLGLLAFSLLSSKLPSYILPLSRWVALLYARVIAREAAGPLVPRAVQACVVLAVLGSVATVAALRVVDASIGSQSSMRRIGAALRAQGAGLVLVDHYRPGMEIYFGPSVLYLVGRPRREIAGDRGVSAELGRSHFLTAAELGDGAGLDAAEALWVVRRADRPAPELQAFGARHGVARRMVVGDFLLEELR